MDLNVIISSLCERVKQLEAIIRTYREQEQAKQATKDPKS